MDDTLNVTALVLVILQVTVGLAALWFQPRSVNTRQPHRVRYILVLGAVPGVFCLQSVKIKRTY